MDNVGKDFGKMFLELPERANVYTSAPMWKRALALIMDLLVINFIIIPPFREILTGFVSGGLTAIDDVIPADVYAAVIIISLLALLYFSLLQHYSQQTIGMMVMNIYVIPRPGFFRSVVRNLFLIPIFPFNLLWFVEPVYLYFRGRRILERVSGTNTVEVAYG